MLSASKAQVEGFVSPQEVQQASPYIEMYNLVAKCKNLGVNVPLESLTTHDLDMIHEFHVTFENTHSKVNK